MKKYLLFIVLLLLNGYNKLSAQSSIPAAQSVFMYNFTRLIEWPAEFKTGDFSIGVIGSNEVFNELKNYTNSKMVGAQPIKIIKFNSAAEVSKCQILFVAYGKTKELPEILAKLGAKGTLVVSENKGAIEKGSAINFVILEDKLKFELKLSNATSNGLKIHSNLENMASTKY
ncbi:MAG: YfiR family protein [Bacteroidales bacterium]|nr:YfiR family protein [Bacteroidales bacterium]